MKKGVIFALTFFLIYLANVVIAKVQISMGNNTPVHLGVVGEFLLLFAASVTFVYTSLRAEREKKAVTEE